MNIAAGTFLVLHGLVHLLYFGHSIKFFELQPGMTWPDGSWVFGKLLGDRASRNLAGAACVTATIIFITGAIGLFTAQAWWRPIIIGSAVFSSVIFILFWDGKRQALPNKGLFAILINVAILIALLFTTWLQL